MRPNIKDLYCLYVHIYKTNLVDQKKRHLFRELLAGEEWTWRVVGISVNALERFKENEYKKPLGIQRDHIKPFKHTSKLMLATLLTEDEWCRLAYESEEVRLVTKEENATRDVS